MTTRACLLHGREFCGTPECAPAYVKAAPRWKPPTATERAADFAARDAEETAERARDERFRHLDQTPYEKRMFAEDVRRHGLNVAADKAAKREAYKTKPVRR